MFQDLKIIDFHSHFPNVVPGRDKRIQEMTAKIGERRMKLLREQALAYNREWRLAWNFPEPEKEHPSDEMQSDRCT